MIYSETSIKDYQVTCDPFQLLEKSLRKYFRGVLI